MKATVGERRLACLFLVLGSTDRGTGFMVAPRSTMRPVEGWSCVVPAERWTSTSLFRLVSVLLSFLCECYAITVGRPLDTAYCAWALGWVVRGVPYIIV